MRPARVAFGWLALIAAACGGGDTEVRSFAARGSARGFDVLLVTFDTTRADHIGCYGSVDARTPAVDALAARGVRFVHALAPTPLTLPSHSTIMTGLEPPSHGVRNNGTFRLDAEHATLAERLSRAGYATGAIAGAFVVDARYGLAQGFDHYDDEVDRSAPAEGGHYNERTADDVTDAAIAWLDSLEPGPFFLWVHYFDPHAPYLSPAPGVDGTYASELTRADTELDRLLRAIGHERLAETLVVFTADHGEGLGAHGEPSHGHFVYEATTRVPLVLSCPTLFDRAHVVDDRVAGLVDVAPTILGLLGLGPDGPVDGIDLLGTAPDASRAIYSESLAPLFNHGWAPLFALRRLNDKYIDAPRPEYYDLALDPDESTNRVEESPAARELARALAERLEAFPAAGLVEERELDAEEADRLAALGYVHSDATPETVGVLDPKDMFPVWEAMIRAAELSGAGDYDRALELVDDALRTSPGDAFVWETAYLVHVRRGDYERAEESMRRAIELHPRAECYVRLAQLALQRGDRYALEDALSAAERLDPLHGAVFLMRGERDAKAGDWKAARAHFEHALEVDPVRSGKKAMERLRMLKRAEYEDQR